ncbi:hypothetical protein Hanom_Chr08g00743241 [Helianthus anomalus]
MDLQKVHLESKSDRKGSRSYERTSRGRRTTKGCALKICFEELRMAIKQLVEEPNTTFEASA